MDQPLIHRRKAFFGNKYGIKLADVTVEPSVSYIRILRGMGCGTHKLSKKFLNKTDLIELQKYPEELNEKRIKILKWMEENLELKTEMNDYQKLNWKNIKEIEQLSSWQEAWQREQELVKHSSMVDSCESRMPCITSIDDNLRYVCNEDVETFWKDFEKTDQSK